jgi:hypothetical protein
MVYYAAALYLIPVPEYGAGDLSFEGTWSVGLTGTSCPGDSFRKPTMRTAYSRNSQRFV